MGKQSSSALERRRSSLSAGVRGLDLGSGPLSPSAPALPGCMARERSKADQASAALPGQPSANTCNRRRNRRGWPKERFCYEIPDGYVRFTESADARPLWARLDSDPKFQLTASKSVAFESNHAGSLPFMPARRELRAGRSTLLDFFGIVPEATMQGRNPHKVIAEAKPVRSYAVSGYFGGGGSDAQIAD